MNPSPHRRPRHPAPPVAAAPPPGPAQETCSTIEAARALGMAVRSVQMMVDRGDLQAWKTPGGHRRILLDSVERWRRDRGAAAPALAGPASAPAAATWPDAPPARASDGPLRVLLIEDSVHYQNLIGMLVRRHLPHAELHVADDGISGLAMAGRLEPDLLLVDILLPGIDGAALITSVRSHPQFARSRLVVVTSLDESQRAVYAYALEGVPVVHKSQLVTHLPPLLQAAAAAAPPPRAAAR